MTKLTKIISSFLITLTIVMAININFVNAVDLNLTENPSNNTSNVNSSNTLDNENNYYANSSITNTPSATVKTGNVADSSLNLSNILNIFLIVVGILLILLAIAILIRLKN